MHMYIRCCTSPECWLGSWGPGTYPRQQGHMDGFALDQVPTPHCHPLCHSCNLVNAGEFMLRATPPRN